MERDISRIHYYPFIPNWDNENCWRLEVARHPEDVRNALEGYRRVLTDEAIYSQSWALHPMVSDCLFKTSRWRFLETGIMLRQLRELNDYPRRLLNRQSYAQARAELRAALLLTRMGYRVSRDPSNNGISSAQRRSGPDWLAVGADGSFGVEVKCPHESNNFRARAELVTHLARRIPDLVGAKQVDIALNSNAIADCTIGDWANKNRADCLLLNALADSESSGVGVTELGTVSSAASGTSSSTIGPILQDDDHEAKRLRSLVQKAAEQLRSYGPGGVVVIDTSIDRTIMERCCCIAEAMNEPWASALALVLLIADTYPGVALTAVPGPRFRGTVPARVCSGGHLHVDTFRRWADCTLDARFYDFPAWCVAGLGHRRARAKAR